MKIKRTTYGEFNKKYGGLRRMTTNREETNLKVSKGIMMPLIYRVNACYIKQKKCTDIALTILGYIDFFGPSEKDHTVVVRLDGKINVEDIIKEDFAYKKNFTAIYEELYNVWREEMKEEKES